MCMDRWMEPLKSSARKFSTQAMFIEHMAQCVRQAEVYERLIGRSDAIMW